ncbi:hypothetical protein [Variovorax sp.]|uniref:hypothetical protein n=1 Tax=Variovorax sp. TaxID=1871043 RepID=UPI002D671D84|nr:hypothetical protein [Variovorax sp.]HYP84981.1 hypothetical protein [Variovorax sp.]
MQDSDLVTSDHAALASHMAHCARARGAWFEVRRWLQDGHVMLSSRLVTVALVGGVSLAAVTLAAVSLVA